MVGHRPTHDQPREQVLDESFGFIGSTYKSGPKKGKCNLSNSASTVAQMGEVYGNGTVSF